MRDASTIVSQTHKSPPKREAPPPSRIKLSPVHRLTRAHLSLAERPQAVEEAQAALKAVEAHLVEQLGAPVTLSARLADATLHPFSHLARQVVYALFELNGDAVGVLEVDAIATGAVLQLVSGTKPATLATPGALTRIEEAAFGWLLLSVLNTLRGVAPVAARYAPRLISFHTERAPVLTTLDGRRRHLGVEVSVTIGEQRGHARLVLPAMWLQSTLAAVEPAPPGELAPELGAAALDARCLLGSLKLGADEAAALTAGDVIVFDGVTGDASALLGPGRLVTPAFELFGAFTADGFTLTRASERPTLENAMSNVDPSLPVDVEIELARLRLPLQQLASLRPGGVLPLHVNAAQTVIIRIGDKPVARAELVEIEGEIGARILSLI